MRENCLNCDTKLSRIPEQPNHWLFCGRCEAHMFPPWRPSLLYVGRPDPRPA